MRMSDRLRALNRVGMELMHERELPVLLERILTTAKSLTHSDGLALFVVDRQGATPELVLDRFRVDSLSKATSPIDRGTSM